MNSHNYMRSQLFKKIKEKKKLNNFQKEIDLAIGNTMERYGEASSYFFKEYPKLKYMKDNWKSQSSTQKGFAAEVKTVSRTNAENSINGNNKRIARTDDIGKVNHPKYDSVEINKDGTPKLDNSGNYMGGAQEKFHESVESYDKYYKTEVKIKGKIVNLYEKYEGGKIDVPSDKITEIKDRWNEEIRNLENQETYLKKNGNAELANKKREEIERIKDAKKRLRDSKVTIKESIEARENPLLSTAKDIGKVANKAGVKAAKSGAVIGGVVSGVQNTKKILDGEKEIKEAAFDVAKDTGKAAIKSYGTAASSAAVGGALKASSKQVLQNLAKKNGPTTIVATGA